MQKITLTLMDDSILDFSYYKVTAKTKYLTILNDNMEYVLVPNKTTYNFDDTHFIIVHQEGCARYVSETSNFPIKDIQSKIYGLKITTNDLKKFANKV